MHLPIPTAFSHRLSMVLEVRASQAVSGGDVATREEESSDRRRRRRGGRMSEGREKEDRIGQEKERNFVHLFPSSFLQDINEFRISLTYYVMTSHRYSYHHHNFIYIIFVTVNQYRTVS